MTSDDDYMCPFCVTPWKCNGPHIPEDDFQDFVLYMDDVREEMRNNIISKLLEMPVISVDGVDYIRRSDAIDICEVLPE